VRRPDILITTGLRHSAPACVGNKAAPEVVNQTPVSFTALHARRNTFRMSFHAFLCLRIDEDQSLLMCRG